MIENSLRYAGDAPVTIRAHLLGRQVAIQVSDQGPGDRRAPRSTGSSSRSIAGRQDGASGSGLGLAIARGFAEANSGTLRLRSAPQQGATFSFQLPVAPERAPVASGMSDRTRVLICDDEPQILRALRVILGDAGFEVVPALTAAEALDAVAVRPPDAAIIDLVLPDGDGVDVCRSIREWSEMPILVLSAVGDEREKVRALDAGADDYVTKPFGPDELVARLRAALRRVVAERRRRAGAGASARWRSTCRGGRVTGRARKST